MSAPNKVAFFVWNANHGKIITIDNLIRSIIGVSYSNLMENQLITLYGRRETWGLGLAILTWIEFFRSSWQDFY